jgi:hypothetical protein
MRRKEMGQLKVVVHAQGVRRFAARAPNRGRWSASAGVMMVVGWCTAQHEWPGGR